MKPIVSDKNKKLFSPTFKTILGNKQVEVSLKQFINNPRIYINTGMSYLYENKKELQAYLLKNTKNPVAEKLDMSRATRGTTFNKKQSSQAELSKEASKMVAEQLKRRKRLAERFAKNQSAEKAKLAKQAKEAASSNQAQTAADKAKEAAKNAAKNK